MVRVWAEEMGENMHGLKVWAAIPQEHQHPPVGIEFPDLPGSDCVHKFHDGPTYGYSNTWKRLRVWSRNALSPFCMRTPGKD